MNTYKVVWPGRDGREVTVRRRTDHVDLYVGDTIVAGRGDLLSDDAVASYLKIHLAVNPNKVYNFARRLGVKTTVGYDMDMTDETAAELQKRLGDSVRLEKVEIPRNPFSGLYAEMSRIALARQRTETICG